MSVYISGVEMPKEHPLYITLRPDGSVHVWDSYSGGGYGTQAVPVPPHGELIEREPILDVMRKERDRISETYGPNDAYVNCLNKYAISIVTSAKTIIPSECKEWPEWRSKVLGKPYSADKEEEE